MDWNFLDNTTSHGMKIVSVPSTITDGSTMREQNGVEIYIGKEHDGLEDCVRIALTKKEWQELKRNINGVFKK